MANELKLGLNYSDKCNDLYSSSIQSTLILGLFLDNTTVEFTMLQKNNYLL